ncbi:MAG: ferric reductase-like transmembrane domain-containing protein [Flavisolibacter sp.]
MLLNLSSLAGLFALVILSFNFSLGLLLATAYKRSTLWKKLPGLIQSADVNAIHNWTAYVALSLIFLHPLLLVLDPGSHFHISQVLTLKTAPHQSFWVALGVISLYSVILLIVTTQKAIKRKMGFRFWKNIHLISYLTVLLVCLHGIFMDPELKDRSPDFLDGEKLVCEACMLLLIITSVIRFRYHRKQLSLKT